MTLPTIDQARSWRGLTLVATDNEPVGRIEAIYVDRTTRQPEWALVHTGLFGSARTFVPLADAAQRGDIVRVPHETSVVREAPRLEQDAELSEEDEARLYAHYGIQYTTDESSSGLPVGVPASPDGGTAPAATDATTELPPASSRLQADAPAAAGVASGTSQTVTTPGDDAAGGGRRKQAAAAGIGAVALAAAARRRGRAAPPPPAPPSLGERVGQAGREAVDALTRPPRIPARPSTTRRGRPAGAKPSRKAARKASRAGQDAVDAGLRAAQVALAAGLAAVEDSRRAARKAARKAPQAAAGQDAASEGGRRAAKRARKEAAAAAAAAEATVESKRRAAKRAQEKAAAATAGAARSVAAAPAAAGRRVQQARRRQAGKEGHPKTATEVEDEGDGQARNGRRCRGRLRPRRQGRAGALRPDHRQRPPAARQAAGEAGRRQRPGRPRGPPGAGRQQGGRQGPRGRGQGRRHRVGHHRGHDRRHHDHHHPGDPEHVRHLGQHHHAERPQHPRAAPPPPARPSAPRRPASASPRAADRVPDAPSRVRPGGVACSPAWSTATEDAGSPDRPPACGRGVGAR